MPTSATTLPKPDPKHIANFARLEPWLVRGDQPDRAGYKWLALHDVNLVVNFRLRDLHKKVEKAAPHLEYIHIPVKNDRPPTEEQALQWLELCRRNAPARTLFGHCKGGAGRTSTFCALVRIAQGWPLAEAVTEQRKYGFEPEAEHKKQARFLADFFARVTDGALQIPKLS